MDSVLMITLATVLLVLVFQFTNGYSDSAPVVAAVISSGAMSPRNALAAVALFEFLGAYALGTAVAKTIGTGIVEPGMFSVQLILAATASSIAWNVVTWYSAVPSDPPRFLGPIVT